MKSSLAFVASALASAAAVCFPTTGEAQEPGLQQSDLEARYEAAIAERDAGKHDTACPELKEIVRLRTLSTGDPGKGLGARLELAVCYEEARKPASALEEYKQLQSLASTAGKKSLEATARKKLAELGPKVSTLTIIVPPDVAVLKEMSVRLDDKAIERDAWGIPLPIDAGKHAVHVVAAERLPWKGSFKIPSNDTHVSVKIGKPRLKSSGVPLGTTEEILDLLDVSGRPIEDKTEAARSWQRPLAYTIFGLGAVGVGLAAGLSVDAASKLDTSRRHCAPIGEDTVECDARGSGLLSSGRFSADVATGALVAGGILMASGLVVWLTAPSGQASKEAASVQILPAPGGSVTTLRYEW